VGTTNVCPERLGNISRKANHPSPLATIEEGISPLIILVKRLGDIDWREALLRRGFGEGFGRLSMST
jgi:hypothetical protein